MLWSHLWFPLSKGSKEAFKPSSKSPSQSQGRPPSIAGTKLWQEFAAQLLHKEFQDRSAGKILSGFTKFLASGLLGGGEWDKTLSLEMRWEEKAEEPMGSEQATRSPRTNLGLSFKLKLLSDTFPEHITLPAWRSFLSWHPPAAPFLSSLMGAVTVHLLI